MLKEFLKMLAAPALCGAAFLSVVNHADAQGAPTLNSPISVAPSGSGGDDMKARLDRLERQNLELQETVRKLLQTPPTAAVVSTEQLPPPSKDEVRGIVSDYLKERDTKKAADEAKKKKDDADKGFVVGQNMGLRGTWTTGPGSGGFQPWFETEDKAFRIHIGGRIHADWILGATADDNVISGRGGTGPFLEGFNWRRGRLEADGWLNENVDFFVEFDWVNTPFNTGVNARNVTPAGTPTNTQPFANIANVPAPTDVWTSINYLPFLGTFRVGNIKPAIGLEHMISSRFLDFMERSSAFDAYYNRNNGWEPGFLVSNWTEDKLLTYEVSATRTANTGFGFTQGGGTWDYCGRLIWIPCYEDNGRRMVHLGLGGKWQELDRSVGAPAGQAPGIANFNQRWLLRNAQSNLQNVVAFIQMNADSQAMINPEFFLNYGPLSIQAEYFGSHVSGVTRFSNQLALNQNTAQRTFDSQSYYVQAMYFLTGEHRPYGLGSLHSSGPAPTRVVPLRNFYWVPGSHGSIFSSGAWQVGVRYCWSSLDDGAVVGGTVNEVTFGLNWFLNPNMKFQWNYDIGHRDLPGGTSTGDFSGFGMRLAFDF